MFLFLKYMCFYLSRTLVDDKKQTKKIANNCLNFTTISQLHSLHQNLEHISHLHQIFVSQHFNHFLALLNLNTTHIHFTSHFTLISEHYLVTPPRYVQYTLGDITLLSLSFFTIFLDLVVRPDLGSHCYLPAGLWKAEMETKSGKI